MAERRKRPRRPSTNQHTRQPLTSASSHRRPPVRSTTAATETALHESEERYRQLVELSPTPVAVHVDGTLAYVNPAALALFGAQSAEELIGKSIWDIVPSDYHEQTKQRLSQIRSEGRAAEFRELKLIRLDGELIDVEVASAAITYAGHPAIQTVIRNISDQKRVEQALRASEERYRNLFENANDAIATFTVEGITTSLNRGAEVLLGWTRDELIGQSYNTVLTPAARTIAADRTRRFLAGEDMPSIFEIEMLRKDGTPVLTEARTRPIRDRQGTVIGFQGTYRDIRERKQAEHQLRESQQLQEHIADTLPEILYLYDLATRRVLYCNRRITTVLGYTPADIEGKTIEHLRQLVHADDAAQFATWDQQFASASDDDRFESRYRLKHRNGAYRWLHVRERICTRTETGAPARILGIASDITATRSIHELAGRQHLKRKDLPARLRAFREKLGYTQAEFGRIFGGLNQRQIGSYETGAADPSFDLLFALQAHGYPLEYILGPSSPTLLDETLLHLTSGYSQQAVMAQLAEAIQRMAAQQRDAIARVLRELGLDPTPFTDTERALVERAQESVALHRKKTKS